MIEAVLENRAGTDTAEYTIGGRSLKKESRESLLKMRQLYRDEVAREDALEKIRNGMGAGGTLRVRL